MSSALLLFLATSLTAPVQDPDLGPVVEIDQLNFSFRPPAKWPAQEGLKPVILKFASPPGGPANAIILFRAIDSRDPQPLADFAQGVRDHLSKEFVTHEVVRAPEIKVGGELARLLVVTGTAKEGRKVGLVRAIVQRSLVEIFSIDAIGDQGDLGRLETLLLKVLDSFTFGLPATKEEVEGLGRLGEILPELAPEAVPTEAFHKIMVGGTQKLGHQRQLARRGKQESRAGFEFEADVALRDELGGARAVASRGFFTPDGAFQRVAYEDRVTDPQGNVRVYRETLVIRGRDAEAERDVNGQKSTARFQVPARTFVSDVADVVRGWLALKGKATYSMYVLPPFGREPRIESLEVAALDRLETRAGERDLIAVYAKVSRGRTMWYHFEPDGSLYEVHSGRKSLIEIVRCSRQEAEKP